MAHSNWQAAPLHWGHGPHIFEMFLEASCPFSAKAFFKMKPLLELLGEDVVTVKLRFNPQPWHLFTGVLTRSIIAASTLENGRNKAYAIFEAIGNHRQDFICDNHATGPNRDASPNDIIARIENHTGLDLQAAFAIPDLDKEIKWHAKYARQNSIHGTPTFMIDGVIAPQLGSGDDIAQWAEAIKASTLR